MKFKRSIPYDILIEPTPNDGFIVKVGCVVAAYSNPTALLRDLGQYLENPEQVEKQYNLDIAKLGRVHIGNRPDIQVRRYTPNFGEAMQKTPKGE